MEGKKNTTEDPGRENGEKMSGMIYADVIIDISHESVDHPFTYRIPEELRSVIRPGVRVLVPFGRGNSERTGFCIGIKNRCDYPGGKVKSIISAAEQPGDSGDRRAVELALWIRERYGSTAITALKTVLPRRKGAGMLEHRTVVLTADRDTASEYLERCRKKHRIAQERLIASLLEEPAQPYTLVADKLHITSQVFRALREAGILRIDTEKTYRNPVRQTVIAKEELQLSERQQFIVDSVLQDFDRGKYGISLIHGITGSGKTEVYIRIIEGIVQRGRQAIFLIPEIALTYQTLLRFYRHFGDRVSVLNSSLSDSERADQVRRAAEGSIDVIIGPRSALFTPFPSVGIIVIDEEHEGAYKNEQMPKYHARDVAEHIAAENGALLLLGSATPSLEAYYRAEQGEIRLYSLKERLTGGMLPRVRIADMREEMRSGNRTIFSGALQSLLEDRLNKGEQSMLFLNRRGIAGFVSCRSCGYVLKCPHCDVSLSEHSGGRLVCHYCGYEQQAVKVCPQCGSGYIAGFRAGTEQIEREVKKMFPQARVLRMDADTTARKGSYEKILSAFANEEADILIGTQMIVKGHDFPAVTLVGIILADLSLNSGDYRSGERTFQLLTQAAGRAGRGEKPGEVVIQTYEPDNYSIQYAADQDYEGFYREEITYRRMLRYPPAEHMLSVQVTDPDEDTALTFAGEVRRILEKTPGTDRVRIPDGSSGNEENSLIIGPSPAAIGRIRDLYRFAVYIKDAKYDKLVVCRDRIERLASGLKEQNARFAGTVVQFDFDPVNPF